MQKIVLAILGTVLAGSVAAMEPLNDVALQQVEAQAGADLSLKLSLNHRLEGGKYILDTGTNGICSELQYCRLALALNKRFITGDVNTSSAWQPNSDSGRKVWLVMKGIQGTINIQRLGLDGAELDYKNELGVIQNKSALQFSFDVTKPLEIRNFGFTALSIEQDTFVSPITPENEVLAANTPGYLKVQTYGATAGTTVIATNQVFDHGRETGFLGMNMNGNMFMQGKMMMFGCDGSHPRC